MNRPHVIILHRWANYYALYAGYLSHTDYAITYVTTEAATIAVPADAAEVIVIDTLDDADAVGEAVEELVSRHGKPAGIIALKEDDLLTGATLRARWGCPGPDFAETERFRDKFLMCGTVAAAGYRVPPFALAPDRAAVERFAATHGWPVIVKPSNAHSSMGVQKIDDPTQLDGVDFTQYQTLLVQQFNPHPIYYVDGILRDGQLGPWRASRYLNSCLDFRTGDSIGSLEEDDPVITAAIAEHTLGFLSALTAGPLVFHLELFLEPGPDRPICSFLEVGARAGGAEIPYLWREVHGYDLMHALVDVQLGRDPASHHDSGQFTGLLIISAPAARPCRVIEATSMTGRQPGPYAEVIAQPGEIIPAGDAVFVQVAGRFRFRGATTGDVEAAILATLADFRVHAEAIP